MRSHRMYHIQHWRYTGTTGSSIRQQRPMVCCTLNYWKESIRFHHLQYHHRYTTTNVYHPPNPTQIQNEPPPPVTTLPPPPTTTTTTTTLRPVIIVGGGPVGLLLSILLSDYHVPHIVLERQSMTSRFRHPQAHFINTRSMELFRTISVLPTTPSITSMTNRGTTDTTTNGGQSQKTPPPPPLSPTATTTTTTTLYDRIQRVMAPVRHWQSFRYGTSIYECKDPLAEIIHPVHRPLQSNYDANGRLVVPVTVVPVPPPPQQQHSTNNVSITKSNIDNPTSERCDNNHNNLNDLSVCTVGHLAQHTLGRILYDTAIEKCRNNTTTTTTTTTTSQILFDTSVEQIEWIINNNNNNEPTTTTTTTTTTEPTEPTLLRITTKQQQTNDTPVQKEYYTDLVIAADGAHSTVRQQLWRTEYNNNHDDDTNRRRRHHDNNNNNRNSPTITDMEQQHLINVHVTIPMNIAQEIHTKHDNYAMLYSVYTCDIVAMIVCHTIGEYVIQIPYFPPYQTIEYDFTHSKVVSYMDTIFGYPNISQHCIIHSIAPWTMKSWIAQQYYQLSSSSSSSQPSPKDQTPSSSVTTSNVTSATAGVVVVGDAAHVFPPAGGFGMNTGLQDVHNIAWKIAAHRHCQENRHQSVSSVSQTTQLPSSEDDIFWSLQRVLQSYEQERRPIAQQNAALSIRNYERLLEVTKTLYLNAQHPALLCMILDHSPLPLSIRQGIFRTLLKTALYPLSWLRSTTTTTTATTMNNSDSGTSERNNDWLSYANHIRSNIRQILHTGAGLPLLFPRFEIGFTYHSGATTTIPMSSSNTNDTTPEAPQLVIGRLVPHLRVHVISRNEAQFPNLKYIRVQNTDEESSSPPKSLPLISITDLPTQMTHRTESIPNFVLLCIPTETIASSASTCVDICRIISNRVGGLPVKFAILISDDSNHLNYIDDIQSTTDAVTDSPYLVMRSESTSIPRSFSFAPATNSTPYYVLIRPDGHIAGIVDAITFFTEQNRSDDTTTTVVNTLLEKVY